MSSNMVNSSGTSTSLADGETGLTPSTFPGSSLRHPLSLNSTSLPRSSSDNLSQASFGYPYQHIGIRPTAREADEAGNSDYASSATTDPARTPCGFPSPSSSHNESATPVGSQPTTLAFLTANIAELSATVASLVDSVNGMRAAPKTPAFLNTPVGSLGMLTSIVKDALAETQQMNESNTAGVASLSAMLASLLARITTLSSGVDDIRAKQQHTLEVQSTFLTSFGQVMARQEEAATAEGATLASIAALTETLDELRMEQSTSLAAHTHALKGLPSALHDIRGDTKSTLQTIHGVERLHEYHNATTEALLKIVEQTQPFASLAEQFDTIRFHLEKWAAASPASSPATSGALSADHTGPNTENAEVAFLTSTLDTMRTQLEGARAAATMRETALTKETKEKDALATDLDTERKDRAAVEASLRDTIAELRRQRDEESTHAAAERAARSKAETEKAEAERQLSEWQAARPPPVVEKPQPVVDEPQPAVHSPQPSVGQPQLAMDKSRPVTGEPRPTSGAATQIYGSAAPSTNPNYTQHDNQMSQGQAAPFGRPHFPRYGGPQTNRRDRYGGGYGGGHPGGYLSNDRGDGHRTNDRASGNRSNHREGGYTANNGHGGYRTNDRDSANRANDGESGW